MPTTRVLIVEDDADDARLIIARLRRGGLDLVVDIAMNEGQFQDALRLHAEGPDPEIAAGIQDGLPQMRPRLRGCVDLPPGLADETDAHQDRRSIRHQRLAA